MIACEVRDGTSSSYYTGGITAYRNGSWQMNKETYQKPIFTVSGNTVTVQPSAYTSRPFEVYAVVSSKAKWHDGATGAGKKNSKAIMTIPENFICIIGWVSNGSSAAGGFVQFTSYDEGLWMYKPDTLSVYERHIRNCYGPLTRPAICYYTTQGSYNNQLVVLTEEDYPNTFSWSALYVD